MITGDPPDDGVTISFPGDLRYAAGPVIPGATKVPGYAEHLKLATILVDAHGRVVYFDPPAEEMTGFARAEIIGRDVHVLTGASIPMTSEIFIKLAQNRQGGIVPIRRAGGDVRFASVRSQPVNLPDGSPAYLLQAIDLDREGEGVRHLGMLEGFFHQSAFGFVVLDEHLRFVLVNEALAGLNRRGAPDHVGRHIREVFDSPDMDEYEALLGEVLRTGEPIVDVRIPGAPTSVADARQVWSASWFRVTSWRDLPLAICGIVYDVSSTERPVLDAARGRDRLLLLSRVGALQGANLDMHGSAQDLARLLTAEFCDLAVIDVLDEVITGEPLPFALDESVLLHRLAGSARVSGPIVDRLIDVASPRAARDTHGFAAVLRDQRAQLIQTPGGLPVSDERTSMVREVGGHSFIIAPLRAREVTLGALTCARLGDREQFDHDDLLLVQEIANRTALGIDNSRLYRDEKQAALILQLSLLPESLPKAPEADMAYRYLPNSRSRQAGGDWFDAMVMPGRRMVLVVGDVIGHGIAAAAAMGRYRTAVQSLASIGLEPAALMTRLNDIAMTFGDNAMATCMYVQYDPLQHKCVIASAGHPPLIVEPPGVPPATHEIPAGPMLGAIPGAEYRSYSLPTPPGTRLLLYSDGVVESRSTPLDEGIARVVQQLAVRRGLSEQCDLIMAVTPTDARDDRTVLLAELHGLRRVGE
ncbi:hypothetical protein Afil01_57020 [Actinorhabdospora filicis]|uniref:PAS domain-containing protein n=1 Tax=Actinorhabdospora filicis TaxID=1785913 RepID=A0A9W6SS06_9ACTN|nr:SpoIIE family protein phosphatase [Actinorhabdospora filicis]GLZ80895.1 hypothetical protein Afil01_57020 [Actinorhabdospora filicis]